MVCNDFIFFKTRLFQVAENEVGLIEQLFFMRCVIQYFNWQRLFLYRYRIRDAAYCYSVPHTVVCLSDFRHSVTLNVCLPNKLGLNEIILINS